MPERAAADTGASAKHPATGDANVTTNSEGTQPLPVDQQQQQQQQQDQGQQPAAEPEAVVDIDEQDIIAAKAEAQAEEAEGQGGDDAGSQDGQQPGQQQPNGKKDQQQQPGTLIETDRGLEYRGSGEPVMIPKARFDEVNGRASKAEQDAAYWRGVAEARGQQPAQQGQQQPGGQQSQQTPEQRLIAIGTEVENLATQFDNGEITMTDYKKRERELQAEEQGIREGALLAKVKPADQPANSTNELYLGTLTAQLETEHPWVKVFDEVGTQAEWSFFKAQAIDNLTARGIDPTAGDMGRYELRREVSVLMDQYGPTMVAERAKAKGIAIPGRQAPSQGGQQQNQQQKLLSPAQLARQGKLHLAAGAPPPVRSMTGTPDDGTGMPTESRIETMSDEEIGNLPDAVRNKLLGKTA